MANIATKITINFYCYMKKRSLHDLFFISTIEISKTHWDEARGTNIDLAEYYTIGQIMERYQISRNHLFCVLRGSGITRIKRGNFVYLPKEEVDKALAYRLEKLN